MKKGFYFISRIITFSLLCLFIFYQIKAERYLTDIQNEYAFFDNQKRISYEPFVWFYLRSKIWQINNNRIYWQSIYMPYKEKELLGKYDFLVFNIEFNAYAIKCFYKKKSY